MARARTETHNFGSDSFLDIVCNMVGIIILLVLVVGLRIKDSPPTFTDETSAAESTAESERVPAEVQAIEQQIGGQQTALTDADRERQSVEQRLSATRQAVATQEDAIRRVQQQLAQAQQWQADVQKGMLTKQDQLRGLALAVRAVPGAKPAKTVQLETYPAPVSKTVDRDEAHFQILAGRVVHVPFAALVDKFKADARAKVNASPDSTQIEAVVGPIEDFNLRYVLNQQGHGRFVLERFSFIPLSNRMGETAAEALAQSSRFRQVLASYDPNRTTVTFWTYQDSFEAFRQVRKEVYMLGYSVASRPMSIGQLISGSPDGSKSAAQ